MGEDKPVFRYLLITPHHDVGMAAGLVAIGRLYQTDNDQLYSFLSTMECDEVDAELKKIGKTYALVKVDRYSYAFANGLLAGVFDHIK